MNSAGILLNMELTVMVSDSGNALSDSRRGEALSVGPKIALATRDPVRQSEYGRLAGKLTEERALYSLLATV